MSMGSPLFDEHGKVIDREGLRGVGIAGKPGVFNRKDESTDSARIVRVEGRDEAGKEVRRVEVTPRTVDF